MTDYDRAREAYLRAIAERDQVARELSEALETGSPINKLDEQRTDADLTVADYAETLLTALGITADSEGFVSEGKPFLWMDHDEQVVTWAEQSYACGRCTSYLALVPAPAPEQYDDDGELGEDWWDVVPMGDGHPCSATERAIYRATIVAAPGYPALVGKSHESEG